MGTQFQSINKNIANVARIITDNVFVRIPEDDSVIPGVVLKLEGFNLAGSIKMKTALAIMDDLEIKGALTETLRPHIIESSSGNLGVALSIVCSTRGIPFTCVTDINTSMTNIRLMQIYGADVVIIKERDENGGFLHSRIRYIQKQLKENPGMIWANQYVNPACKEAHIRWTCPAILNNYSTVDYLFVGAGTTGTLMGCCEYFKKHSPGTKVIGVDSIGSVTFTGKSGVRFIPGIGASRRPELFDPELPYELIQMPETETIKMCMYLKKKYGLLVGGSTGTVLAAIPAMAGKIPPNSTIVAISPDLGERYLDTIYDEDWVKHKFPEITDM